MSNFPVTNSGVRWSDVPHGVQKPKTLCKHDEKQGGCKKDGCYYQHFNPESVMFGKEKKESVSHTMTPVHNGQRPPHSKITKDQQYQDAVNSGNLKKAAQLCKEQNTFHQKKAEEWAEREKQVADLIAAKAEAETQAQTDAVLALLAKNPALMALAQQAQQAQQGVSPNQQ
jgi:hypothetical protein